MNKKAKKEDSNPGVIAIYIAHLFDPELMEWDDNVLLEVEPASGVIQSRTSQVTFESCVTKFGQEHDLFYDLRGHWVLPGLIDSHVHPLIATEDYQFHHLKQSSAYKALWGLRKVQEMLECGWTTVRVAGDADIHYAHLEIKRAIDEGLFRGPRMYGAGHYISITGGGGDIHNLGPEHCVHPDGKIVNGKDEMVKAVREEIKYGSNWIKLLVSGAFMSSKDSPLTTHMSEEEVQAAVDEGKKWNVPVMAHCHSDSSIKLAVKCGVRSIEHASFVQPDTLQEIIRKGIWVVPTLLVGEIAKKEFKEGGERDKMLQISKKTNEEFVKSMKSLVTSGANIAVGTDYVGWKDMTANTQELELLHSFGMKPEKAIQCATSSAAKLLGDSKIGVLEPSRFADLIAVASNPVADLTVLRNVVLVMQGGRLVKDARPQKSRF